MKKEKIRLGSLNSTNTIGRIKQNQEESFQRKFKLIGEVDVEILKQLLNKPKIKDGRIRVYITKKRYGDIPKGRLAPLYYKSFVLAPMIIGGIK